MGYRYEDKIQAIKMILEKNMDYATVERRTGISQRTLYEWVRKYKRDGDLPRERVKIPRFNREQRVKAVNHFIFNGKNYSKTCKELGYPTRQVLKKWVEELAPEEIKQTEFTKDEKRMAVELLVNRQNGMKAKDIANELGIPKETLYTWKRQFMPATTKKITILENEYMELLRKIKILEEENEQLRMLVNEKHD